MTSVQWRPRASGRSVAVLIVALLAGCSGDEGDYLVISGGGFVFNYRNADAHYGIVVGAERPLPDGSVIQVSFENPAGGAPVVVTKPAKPDVPRYDFETPGLKGIVKDQPYKVTAVLKDSSGAELQRLEKSYRSDISQEVLPERPLAIGPGYQQNIDRSETPFPPSIYSAGPAPAP
jgi:hypothetical protein